ncbi:MAG: hypothetical protein K6L60_09175 [Oceanobacter sp.]
MELNSIDTSYWKLKDKTWVAERKAAWPAIEKKLAPGRRKSEVNVIKQYFMKGKMPNWEKYKNWGGSKRHVDIFVFLWLHPSSDVDVLTGVCRLYLNLEIIHFKDLLGWDCFLYSEFRWIVDPRLVLNETDAIIVGVKNIAMFRAWISNYDLFRSRLFSMLGEFSILGFPRRPKVLCYYQTYVSFLYFRHWLLCDSKSVVTQTCLYRNLDVLEWIFTNFDSKAEAEFIESMKYQVNDDLYKKSLYCIFNYDTSIEDGTGRAEAVLKLRDFLNEYPYLQEFKKIWEDVNSGQVEVEDAWCFS